MGNYDNRFGSFQKFSYTRINAEGFATEGSYYTVITGEIVCFCNQWHIFEWHLKNGWLSHHLESYKNWLNKFIKLQTLAAADFFFTNTIDSVRWFSVNLEKTDVQIFEHR